MMTVLIVILHVIVCLALIMIVLLQVGKGQSIGAAFGGAGSSQTLFGSRGPATFLSHMTTAAAILFMLTSLGLAYLSSNARERSAITDQAPASESAPAPTQPPTDQAPAPESTPAPMQPTEGQQTEGQQEGQQ
jgi:preprotein translocase subunit SecG